MDKLRMCAFGEPKPCDKKCQFYNTCTRSIKNREAKKDEQDVCKRED